MRACQEPQCGVVYLYRQSRRDLTRGCCWPIYVAVSGNGVLPESLPPEVPVHLPLASDSQVRIKSLIPKCASSWLKVVRSYVQWFKATAVFGRSPVSAR